MTLYEHLYRIVEGDSQNGRRTSTILNRFLLIVILLSVAIVVLETETSIYIKNARFFDVFSMVVGLIFLIEYLLRLYASKANPKYSGKWGRVRYVFSFWAIVDLIAVLPLFITVFDSTPFLARLFRMLRIIRLMKAGRYSQALDALCGAIRARKYELFISCLIAFLMLFTSATGLYLVEGDIQPDKFGSIPRALWWSIATLTIVGYGDVTPVTVIGRVLAGFTALAGIGLIAMPTGILAAAFSAAFQKTKNTKA